MHKQYCVILCNLFRMTFAQPYFLLLLIIVPLIAWHRQRQKKQYEPSFTLSNTDFLKLPAYRTTWRAKLRPYLYWLNLAALLLLIIALARPQSQYAEKKVDAEGIDIVLSLDISGSMLARDFEPDRLGASTAMAAEFIKNRPYDRIGLVVFAGESFTQCPATTDHKVLLTLLDNIKQNAPIADGTAIGMGLATAVTRLQDSQAKSKVIILLTDGVNNAGFIDPLTAAETARQYHIKTYTIGVGTKGYAPYPVQGMFGTTYQQMEVQIDEALLQQIADATGGKYYRATNNESLKNVYAEINQLEKSKIEVTTISRYTELFYPFAIAAATLLFMGLLLKQTLFRGLE